MCGHEWEAIVCNRTYRNDKCPYCSGRYTSFEKSLLITHPEIAAQWHYVKNGDLKSSQVSHASRKKVWWCNSVCGHEWDMRIEHRTRGVNCPYCSGFRVSESNSLATQNPKIAAQWHDTKNGKLTPEMVTSNSNKRVWWFNSICGHEWDARIVDRNIKKYNCPYCRGYRVDVTNCLSKTHSEIAAQWHPTKNGNLTPEVVTHGTQKRVWWHDPMCGHEWITSVLCRTRGTNCPKCKVSKNQKLVFDFVKENFPFNLVEFDFWHPQLRFKKSNRKMQLDIFIPHINVAIEYQGEQHFFPIYGKNKLKNLKKLDKEKRIACQRKNIVLFYIDYTWKQSKEIVKNILSSYVK
jgi:uncharacterized Zn-finger protein